MKTTLQTRTAGTAQGLALVTAPLFSMLGAVLIAPLLATMFAEFKDTPYANVIVPLLLTAPALFLALMSPLTGILGDKIGARKVLLCSLAVYGFAGMAPLFLDSLYSILASRLLLGIAEAGLVTASMSLLSNYFQGDKRQKWIAYQMVVLPWAGAIIMGLAGVLADIEWRLAFSMYSLSFLTLFFGLFVLYDPKPEDEISAPVTPTEIEDTPTTQPLTWKLMLHFAVIAVPGSIAFYTAPTQLAFLLDAHGFSNPSTSANITAIGLVISAAGALVTRKLTHIPAGKVLTLGFSLMGIGLILMAQGGNVPTIATGLVLQQVGGGAMLVTAMTYLLSFASVTERGKFSGFWWFTYTLAQFFTPLVLSGLQAITGSRITAITVIGAAIVVYCTWLLSNKSMLRAVVPGANGSPKQSTTAT